MGTPRPKGNLFNKLQLQSNFVKHAFVVCLWVTSLLMYLIMLAGIMVILRGITKIDVVQEIVNIFRHSPPANTKEVSTALCQTSAPDSVDDNEGLIEILHGMELIFVSPLFYLLISFFTKYTSLANPEVQEAGKIETNIARKKIVVDYLLSELTIVKLLSTGLFLSILISHSISLILRKDMTFSDLFYTIALIPVLIGYYYILHTMIEKARKKENGGTDNTQDQEAASH